MGVHRFAVATALVTFCLLIAGGLVSTTESGLACPDWPLCEGQFIPPMRDGKQFEHTHRLTALFTMTMTAGICALAFKHRRRDKVLVRIATGAVLMVIAQALLGALTVILKLPAWVSSTHQANGMAFFALIVTFAFLTYQRLPDRKPSAPADGSLRPWMLAVLAACYAQIVLGAVMRHTRGGLACGFDYPLCRGQIWPLGDIGLEAHLVHRWFGTMVGAAIFALTAALLRSQTVPSRVKQLSLVACVGVLAQVALGVATIWTSRNLVVMTIHSSVGAALLACLVSRYWLAYPMKRLTDEEVAPVLAPNTFAEPT